MARPPKSEKQTPSSIRIPSELLGEIKRVAAIMGKSDAEVIRLATEIGLEHLRRIDYSLAKAVVDATEGNGKKFGKNHRPKAA